MKQLLILILISAFSALAIAQPPASRLDADLKRLNRRFENVETIRRKEKDGNSEIRLKRAIESAEKALGRFKKKYPNQDTSTFKRDLASFKNPQAASGSATLGSTGSSTSVSSYSRVEDLIAVIDEILDFLPDARSFIQDDKDALKLTKKQLESFREKMSRLITPDFTALANNNSNRKIKRAADKVARAAKSLQTELSRTDVKKIRAETKQNLMLSKYFKVAFAQEKLKLLGKIYQNRADITAVNKIADDLITQLGTVDDIEKQGAANYAALVAKRRLYPNRQNSKALKNQAIRAFKSSVWTRGEFANSQILKVHLVSSGWSVARNKVTGIILSRDQQAQLAVKTSDGKCHAYLILLEQKHKGGGRYGGAYMRSGSNVEMLCKNVPK